MFPEDMQMLREDAEDAVVDQAIDNGEVDLDNIPEDEPNDIDLDSFYNKKIIEWSE